VSKKRQGKSGSPARRQIHTVRAQPAPAKPEALDPALPSTPAEIEAAQDAALRRLADEPPGEVVDDADGTRTLQMSEGQGLFMKLQLQLFRVVFGREPGPGDPVFWDRAREREGVFRMEDSSRQLSQHLLAAGVRPEIAYAAGITGRLLTEGAAARLSRADRDEWRDAVRDHQRQAKAGHPPVLPEELIAAVRAATAGGREVLAEELLARVTDALDGDEAKARCALDRIAALVLLAEEEQIPGLSAGAIPEPVVAVAAAAELDETRRFRRADFFRRLKVTGWDPEKEMRRVLH
jgi:hypothetical protein